MGSSGTTKDVRMVVTISISIIYLFLFDHAKLGQPTHKNGTAGPINSFIHDQSLAVLWFFNVVLGSSGQGEGLNLLIRLISAIPKL